MSPKAATPKPAASQAPVKKPAEEEPEKAESPAKVEGSEEDDSESSESETKSSEADKKNKEPAKSDKKKKKKKPLHLVRKGGQITVRRRGSALGKNSGDADPQKKKDTKSVNMLQYYLT